LRKIQVNIVNLKKLLTNTYCLLFLSVVQTVLKKREFLWAIYDFADTIFSMNVVSLYFPLLIVSDLGGKDIHVGIANSVSQLLVVFAAPILGIISDRSGKRMNFFIATALITTIGTIAIGLTAKLGVILPVIIMFIIANFFYQLSLTFYNSLLPRVGHSSRWGKISGLGTALGYLGSIIGMALVMPFNEGMFFKWQTPISAGGHIATFIPTAILFSIFALPTILYFTSDELRTKYPRDKSKAHPFRKIIDTFRDTKSFPGIRRFIIARFFFQEGVETTIVFMAIFAEKAMAMPDNAKILFFVIATTAAVIGSFLWGRITDSIGHHRALMLVLAGWIIGLAILALFPYRNVFWAVGCWLGIMLGGVWTTSRPYLLRLAPADKVGRFFGLYSLSGKAAAVVGPLVWGLVILFVERWSEQLAYRSAVVSMAVLVAIGFVLLAPNSKIFFRKSKL